jgi:hypothetical protein
MGLRIALRRVSPRSQEPEDWIVEATADTVRIRFGSTGKKLRTTVIPLVKVRKSTQTEAQLRVQEKLAAGYEIVSNETFDDAQADTTDDSADQAPAPVASFIVTNPKADALIAEAQRLTRTLYEANWPASSLCKDGLLRVLCGSETVELPTSGVRPGAVTHPVTAALLLAMSEKAKGLSVGATQNNQTWSSANTGDRQKISKYLLDRTTQVLGADQAFDLLSALGLVLNLRIKTSTTWF